VCSFVCALINDSVVFYVSLSVLYCVVITSWNSFVEQ
jgi:hypothetical protein